VIAGHLYKMGNDKILRKYVLEFERGQILAKAHGGLLADIMRVMTQPRRLLTQDYGGLLYIKIQKHIVELAMYVNGQGNHHEEMKCRSSHS